MSVQSSNGYYHATPGRLRVRVANLKNDRQAAKSLELLLLSQPGITGVKANHITGNVLVKFNESVTFPQAILQSLADLGHIPLTCENKPDATWDSDAICDFGLTLGKNLTKIALKQALSGSAAAIILELL